MKNRTTRKAQRAPEWAITVRLDDGACLYYSMRLDARGQRDWSPRASEAERYATEEKAAQIAGTFKTNRKAKEYEVVRLAQP